MFADGLRSLIGLYVGEDVANYSVELLAGAAVSDRRQLMSVWMTNV
jgi:hypothetical protein